MDDPSHLADLVARYCEGTLDGPEAAELATLVETSQTARQELARQMLVHRLLPELERPALDVARLLAALPDAPASAADRVMGTIAGGTPVVEHGRLSDENKRPAARRPRRLGVRAVAAAVTVTASLTGGWLLIRPLIRPRPEPASPPHDLSTAIDRLPILPTEGTGQTWRSRRGPPDGPTPRTEGVVLRGRLERWDGARWVGWARAPGKPLTWDRGLRLRTGTSPARARLPDGTSVFLAAATAVRVGEQASTLELEAGQVVVDRAPRNRAPSPAPASQPTSFIVGVPPALARAEVLPGAGGLSFALRRSPEGVRLTVARGSGVVSAGGRSVEVAAGFTAEARPGEPPSASRVADQSRGLSAVSALEPGREAIYHFDFEAPARPVLWKTGRLVRGPLNEGGRFVLAGERYAPRAPSILGAYFEDRKLGLFKYADGTRLAFDYWLGEWSDKRAPTMQIWINDATHREPYYLNLRGLDAARWVRVDVALADFLPQHPQRGLGRLAAGDLIDFVLVRADAKEQDVFFLDNVEVTRGPAEEEEVLVPAPASPEGK